jgi:hypothetical protein
MMKSRPFPGNVTRASRCPLFDFGIRPISLR